MSDETNAALQKITKGAGVVFLGTMLQLALAFFAKAIMARFLDIPQYGLVSLGILVLNIGATVSLLGLDTGVSRFLPRYDADRQRRNVVRSSYQIAVPTSFAVGALVYVLAGEISTLIFGDPSLTQVLKIMAIGVPFWVLLDLGVGVTRGVEDARPRVYAKNFLLPGTRFLLVALVALFGLGVAGMASAYVLSYGIAAIAISGLVWRRIGPPIGIDADEIRAAVTALADRPSRSMYRRLLLFSTPLLFGGVSSFLVRNVDLVLLGMLRDSAQVGIYNVAYPLARLLTVLPGAFGFLFVPVVSNLHADDQMREARRVFQLTAKWLFLLTTPVFVVMLLAPELLISVLFGAKYVAGGLTLSVLAVGFFVHSLLGLNSNTLTSIGRSRIIMLGQLAALAINIVLNLLLIPRYGFLGAGIATTVSYLLQNVIYSTVLYRNTGIQPFTPSMVRPAAVIGLVSGLLYVLTRILTVTLPLLVALFLGFLCVYAVGILRFGGIDEEDVMLLNAVEDQTGIDLEPIKGTMRSLMK